jgi:hypothetical protein
VTLATNHATPFWRALYASSTGIQANEHTEECVQGGQSVPGSEIFLEKAGIFAADLSFVSNEPSAPTDFG